MRTLLGSRRHLAGSPFGMEKGGAAAREKFKVLSLFECAAGTALEFTGRAGGVGYLASNNKNKRLASKPRDSNKNGPTIALSGIALMKIMRRGSTDNKPPVRLLCAGGARRHAPRQQRRSAPRRMHT